MSSWKSLSVALMLCIASELAKAEGPRPSLVRGYYWNRGDLLPSLSDAERLERFRKFGVTRVHLWLNDNNRTIPPCDHHFQYRDEGGGRLWTPARLDEFTRALQGAGLTVVYTMSVELRTKGYIDSLSAPGGPLAIAKTRQVEVELDVEGNGGTQSLCPGDGLTVDKADDVVVKAVQAAGVPLVVTTSGGWDLKHPKLLEAAKVVTPQLYDDRHALPLAELNAALDRMLARYPTKTVRVGVSVQCSAEAQKLGRCSHAQFDAELKELARRQALPGNRIEGYEVWGERELKACPSPVCSVFGADYLAATATR